MNPDTKHQGALAGDASLRGVISRLRRELSAPGGTSAGLTFLSDVGIKFEKDGSLTFDASKLTKALDTDPTGVSNLFTIVQNGIGKRIPDAVDDFISAVDGVLTSRQKGVLSNIDRIDKNIERETIRVTAMQDRLTQQFSALEKIVSSLKSQGDFLTQSWPVSPAIAINLLRDHEQRTATASVQTQPTDDNGLRNRAPDVLSRGPSTL